MRLSSLRLELVDSAPVELARGVFYVSMPFRTTMHLCACGCGNQVVMPLRPDRWSLTFDGETVTMHPSVGNGSFGCRSHYWIRGSEVVWLPDFGEPSTGELVPTGRPSVLRRALEALRGRLGDRR